MEMKVVLLFAVILFADVTFISVSGQSEVEPPLLKLNVTQNNITCILAEFAGTIVLTDPIDANKTMTVNITGTTNLNESSCGTDMQRLSIADGKGMGLNFWFAKEDNTSLMLSSISLFYDDYYYVSNSTLYKVDFGNTYQCDSGITTDLIKQHTNTTAKISLKSVKFNAFRKVLGGDFETSSVCSADAKSNKTIPMIIAFVLAGMVVIMLVGYIILRRREDKSAYQTV